MLPNREGLFNAYPADVGVDETGPNKLATCIVNFRLYEELQPSGEWADCSADKFDITGYFYLEKKDGDINAVTVDALKAALGWDGRDPFWLQETDFSQHPVQVRLAIEEYQGKTRLKVQYLNPYGSTGGGGVTKADAATKTAIRNRLGSKLRATAGPAPAAAPPAAAPPKLPPAKPKAQPDSTPTTDSTFGPEATMDEAWAEFVKHCTGPKWDQKTVEEEWFRILADLFPGKQPDELSPTEWALLRDKGPAEIIPF